MRIKFEKIWKKKLKTNQTKKLKLAKYKYNNNNKYIFFYI